MSSNIFPKVLENAVIKSVEETNLNQSTPTNIYSSTIWIKTHYHIDELLIKSPTKKMISFMSSLNDIEWKLKVWYIENDSSAFKLKTLCIYL